MVSTVKLKLRLNRLAILTLVLFGMVSWLSSNHAQAATTFTVTTAGDNGDNANPTPGSLRAAIISANTTPGTDTINFGIGTGIQTIAPPSSLPIISDPVIIDGTSQPGFAGVPIIELNGATAGANSTGLHITAGSSTVKGLVINRFTTGIYLKTAGNNLIVGNYIGTDVGGTIDHGNTSYGINAEGGSGNTIGGTTQAERNVISGNNNTGLRLSGSSQNLVLGNYIGTDRFGTADLGNGNQGLRVDNTTGNRIGGTAAGEGNVISGNSDVGVRITSSGGTKVIGNRIGTDVNGTASLPNDAGGVHVFSGSDNEISANSISFNGELGIDLDVDHSAPPDGVTPNDLNDADTGSNNLQNFPVITAITPQGGSTLVSGSLNSTANTQFRLEFFASSQCDPSGSGEGQTFIGSTNVTTVGNNANFTATLPVAVSASQFVTVTAIDPTGNTSEFSKCEGGGLPAPVSLSIADVSQQEGNSGTTNFVFNVTLSPSSNQTVTVDYATVAGGSATLGNDYQPANGTLTFTPGQTSQPISVAVNGDTSPEPDETFLVILSNNSNAALGKSTGTGTIIDDESLKVQFSSNNYSFTEGAGSIQINVQRIGEVNIPFTVNYATSDSAGLQDCNVFNAIASSRCDYVTRVGKLHFAAGASSKTITIPIVDDVYPDGTESFNISLTNPTGGAVLGTNHSAVIQIADNGNDAAGKPNPIDATDFFVRQHYIDFLGREPDPLAQGWINQINNCVPLQPACDRLSVSQGIYGSPEFKDRGYFIYKFFVVALGRKPSYNEFVADYSRVSGFQTDAELEQSKLDFIADFMGRAEFASYNGLTNDQYVQTLYAVAGITQVTVNGEVLNVAAMQQKMAQGKTRAQVLREIAESVEVSARFLTEATIVMHYFGYLRREPDASYQDWITIYNQTGDSRNVTNGFVNSTEYRARFGQ